MKKIYSILTLAGFLGMSLLSARAQFGGGGGMGHGAQVSGVTAKLFGKDSVFTANVQMETSGASGSQAMSVPGKLTFDRGKARFETDLTQMKGGGIPADAVTQMKAMGMDKMVIVSRPDKKLTYMVYPSLKSHLETPAAGDTLSEFKMETTDLGNETLDGHACVKQKAVVTDAEGKKHEATVWKAADLKDLPIKIIQNEQNTLITMTLKNVSLSKPEASLFEVPAESAKYENIMALMQGAMQKQLGGLPAGAASLAPPPAPGKPQK